MDKYKRLALNTVIFAVGSFSSKIFSLVLNNLYTKNIDPAGFYTKSLIETVALFLLPVFTFSMTEAIARFGLDREYEKKRVFTNAAVMSLFGLTVMLAFVPILSVIPFLRPMRGYCILLCIYVWTSSLRQLCSQFTRARGLVKLFSLDGIFTTVTLFFFSIIFISFMGLGVEGFMLATICSDGLSAVCLFFVSNIKRFFDLSCLDRELSEKMLRFAVPLIPSTVMWTFTGFSDQIFISNMHSDTVELGDAAAGIYSAATKVPNLLSMAATIFSMAWNMSAIMVNRSRRKRKFYSHVLKGYQSMLFVSAAFLILTVRPVSALLINYSTFPEYSRAYVYTPMLICASVFVCLNHFIYGIYTATKRSMNAFLTVFATLCANLVMNAVFIPRLGIHGACLATFLSYAACFSLRMADIQRYEPFRYDIMETVVNAVLLILMSISVMTLENRHFLLSIFPAAGIVFLNRKELRRTAERILKRKRV